MARRRRQRPVLRAHHLTEPIALSQPTVSHHLKVLVDAGLMTRTKRGTWSFYALVPGALDDLADLLRTPAR